MLKLTEMIMLNPKNQIEKFFLLIKLFLGIFILLSVLPAQAQSVEELLKDKIENGLKNNGIHIDGIKLYDQDSIPVFYRENEYHPVWSSNKNKDDMMMIIKSSFDEGLNPDDYHYSTIDQLLEKFNNGDKSASNIMKLDLLLSDAMVHYARHLMWGKVDQSELRKAWDLPKAPRPPDIDKLFVMAIDNETLPELFGKLAPQHFMYVHLKKGLERYREIEKSGGWSEIQPGETLKKGMKDERILAIREYLTINSDLNAVNTVNDTVFDEELESAVKSFQFRHNLTNDGVAGKNTIAQMNISVAERIDIIRVNMERARWVSHKLEPDFLVVNIAGYNVRRITNDEVVYYSPVIVGRTYHQSPVFKAKMTYVEVNPTWTLPYSIATKETLPKLQKNKNYLSEKHMVIKDANGNILDPATIDFNQYSRNNFPFTIMQTPGAHNALGEVKFMFPNKYAVYLHDTPARSLFSREDRAFSHGCIRLQKKWELLINLMDEPDVWNMDKINSILATEETTRVKLTKPIDILILYWTAGADKQNRIFFNRDIYDRDKAVLEALNEPFSSN